MVHLSPEQLKRILEEHQNWFESGGKEGKRADLSNADLRKVNLKGVNLAKANLHKADLSEADLSEADLSEADFSNAILCETNFTKAKLCYANLQGTSCLLPRQLAGTNLSCAKLPDVTVKFEELAILEEASKNAGRLFVLILLGCIYSGLTIATTSDAQFFTYSEIPSLPIIGSRIPVVMFYIIAPFILLSLHFYFHSHLQRLWDGLSDLPSIFPDGTPIDRKVSPWLLNSLVQKYSIHLKDKHPVLSSIQVNLSRFLAWWLVPFTLLCFWVSYLRRHDWGVTLLHIAMIVVSVGIGIFFHLIHSKTLRRERSTSRDKIPLKSKAALFLIGIILCLLSLSVIDGVRPYPREQMREENVKFHLWDEYLSISGLEVKGVRTWGPRMFEFFGFIPFADLDGVDVSIKPPNWTGKEEDVYLVKGAQLKGRNLRYASASRVFLVKADLQKINLEGANLEEADLRETNLTKAQLSKGMLLKAKIRKATLYNVNLSNAFLRSADLKEAYLRYADLSNSSLAEADLRKANLSEANLQQADLREADLREAILYRANLTKAVFLNSKLQDAGLQEAELLETDFMGTDLSGANLSGAKIQNTNFFAAKLDKTDICGVDLTTAIYLTKEQIESAIIDEKTQLPAYLKSLNDDS